MTAETTLYTNPMSRGRIARWMIEETGIPYRAVVLSYGPEMKSPDYLALNPMGKVPTLVHRGQVVTECAAICAYLAEAVPEAGLAPSPTERARFFRWLFFCAGPMEQAITNRAMGFEVPEDRKGMSGYGDVERAIATLEKAVAQSDFIAGARFTAADVYVGSQVGWGLQFGTLPASPAFAAYWARIEGRPARLRADALDNAAAPPQPATE